ncbi:uncharacterized protein isoform X3 [Rhodnius prolixus]|uniref:uncharacterized protein isoform X3 n=1 Tax=Rhodnius prolixus TaxID=13249 RepID=UPI003D1899A0
MDQELTDFIVVNYTKPDRDSSIHFLTEVMAKEWQELISPSAKIVYTSSFNAWYLKKCLKVKGITVIGVDPGKSHSVSFHGNKFSFCFIDSKSSTGSVSLFIDGDFGVYFYTGNFCYYSGFTSLMCPQMKGIISYKSLSRLYFDATYYEQKSKFMDYDEIVDKVVGIILCANFSKRTDIVVDIFGLEMLLIDIALNVRKKYPKVQALSTGLNSFLPKQNAPQIIKMDPEPLWKLASSSSYFVKIAGISGASAVILGAYGAHSLLSDDEKDDNVKKAFESANRYHFIHTLALLGVPLCRYPSLSGCLFILGLSMFCGTCYYSSLSGDHRFRRLTPIGGTFFILGWLSLFL